MEKAHRVAWLLERGPIPHGVKILHRCDNPPCVNWRHLFDGTMQDNVDDMMAKGRQVSKRGEEHPFAVLTEAQVQEIRARYVGGDHSYASLARLFGMSKSQIGSILTRKKWAWLS